MTLEELIQVRLYLNSSLKSDELSAEEREANEVAYDVATSLAQMEWTERVTALSAQ